MTVQAPCESVADRIAATARQHPDRIALCSQERSLRYGELLLRINQLAWKLRTLGVGPGDLVAVHMQPSVEAVVALLGVMRAGAAYVPSDPGAPEDRVRVVFEEARVRTAIVDPGGEGGAPCPSPLVLEPGMASLDAAPGGDPAQPVSAEAVAYVIFTSGTTGRPKGICAGHRGLVNLCEAVIDGWGLTPTDRVHQFTPLAFDAAGEAIYPALFAGASVQVRDPLTPGPSEFSALINRQQLTCLTLPPIYMHQWVTELVRKGERIPPSVRLVCMGGDKIALETRRLWDGLGGAHIPWINDYGPTEATVTATTFVCTGNPGAQEQHSFFPIGKPIRNMRAYLLDEQLRQVGPGQPGDLYLAGVGLAHGYLNRPAETAARFLPDPFHPGPGARMYCTGDLAVQRADGNLVFLGRSDDQVKIRGYRVELQEVELTVLRHPGVRDVAVLAVPGAGGDKQLHAYWVPADVRRAPTRAELQEFLRGLLPEYMRVSQWVQLERLPVTDNGKADRKALLQVPLPPAPAADERALEVDPTVALVAEAWAELLGARPGPEDSFFDLGGNSLLAMRLLPQLEEALQISVPLLVLFERPTFAEFSRQIVTLVDEARASAA